ncbi:hypothetical protein HDU98_000959 [Podochytrium sp. JEL0797]|nr:hypothetical protein HDU98_000959 [Podochytrium sp. JEL0797]
MSKDNLLACGNKGCNKTFTEENNAETSCEHHSGAPVFHDALKGWSCCPKRVTDFTDFMNIAGCTVGRHVPATSTPPTATPTPAPAPAAAKPTTIVNGKEVYGTSSPAITPTPSKPSTPTIAPPTTKESDLSDPPTATIPAETACKRRGCTHVYSGPESKDAECVFHNGSPVFHEGSKGWSCCGRKVLEFDEFLKMKGCQVGKHRFLDVAEDESSKQVECRKDWYQTPTTVILSIFAKKLDKSSTTVTFTPTTLSIRATFLDGKHYHADLPLALTILPEESKFVVLGTKMEVSLRKADGLSWPSLEMPAEGVLMKSFTTFGVGMGGSGQDAPLHLLKGDGK